MTGKARGWQRVRTYSLRSASLLALIWLASGASAAKRPVEYFAVSQSASRATGAQDGQHDFDFEFGAWQAHIRRLLHPLTGSDGWVDYDGTSVLRKIWDGRANLGELEVGNPTGHIEGLSLRLYNPQSHQWSIYWANSNDGTLSVPMVGGFQNGRGEFFDQETYEGKAIYVRFIFSQITPASFRLEQSFSADGGKT